MYDREAANNQSISSKIYVGNTGRLIGPHPTKTDTYPQGAGDMVLGRTYTNEDIKYSNVLIDDLAMWNTKLTAEEIEEIGEIEI